VNKLSVKIIKILRFYQKTISPDHGVLIYNPNLRCRFYPSCSQYALESFKKHNLFKAAIKSFYRILRCHPFSKGGMDIP